jgi:EAL domain-containing protein (putative c-di-GMP-specific phosphodiesterase class I)
MQDHSCALCSLQKERDHQSVLLYAATPILTEIVSQHLSQMDASFCLENEIFRISSNQDGVIRELKKRLSDAERADIRVTRSRGAAVMAAATLDQWDRHLDTSWFERAVEADAFTTFFQPIVDTKANRVFAHECLIRLFADRPYNGGEIMEAAIGRGRVHLFDSYARRLSIRSAAVGHQPGTKVFVNFMPSSIYDPAHCMRSTLSELAKTNLQPNDIVFEVVEAEHVRDVKHLKSICDFYRRENFGFALDDVGTGSNSFQMICDLNPDYIKLDKSLVSKLEQPMYYSAIGKLVEFAHQYSLNVIAEGIEEAASVDRLQSLGVRLMQGYYFGKPAAQMVDAGSDLVQLGSKLASLTSQPVNAE